MNIELHVNQKVINEDGNTMVSFVSTLGAIGTNYMSMTIKTTEDTFEVGKEYAVTFVKKV